MRRKLETDERRRKQEAEERRRRQEADEKTQKPAAKEKQINQGGHDHQGREKQNGRKESTKFRETRALQYLRKLPRLSHSFGVSIKPALWRVDIEAEGRAKPLKVVPPYCIDAAWRCHMCRQSHQQTTCWYVGLRA